MAITTVVQYASLSDPVVLSPERYDPRRIQKPDVNSILLSDLISIENPTISIKSLEADLKYLVLDTGDSFEGIVRPRTEPVVASTIRSSKKLVRGGDVIISRLRPYLRQVSFIDDALEDIAANILVSTEFFVLRSRNLEESTAWLVPFLLSPQIQNILGRSQEGGHHPRFTRETLSNLLIPLTTANNRKKTSDSVEANIHSIRNGYINLQKLTR